MARQTLVQSARAFGESGEATRSGREARARAHGRDVVQVAPDPFELEEDRASPSDLTSGVKPANLLDGMGVGDSVRDGAGSACSRDEPGAVVERRALCSSFEAAVLVEQARVEMEDLLADEVEAEVPGLDDPCVDRPDRHLVRVVSSHCDRPAREVEVVVDERP